MMVRTMSSTDDKYSAKLNTTKQISLLQLWLSFDWKWKMFYLTMLIGLFGMINYRIFLYSVPILIIYMFYKSFKEVNK